MPQKIFRTSIEKFPGTCCGLMSTPTPCGASNSEGMRCEKNREVLRSRSGASSGPRWARTLSGQAGDESLYRYLFMDSTHAKPVIESRRGSAPAGAAAPIAKGVWGHQPPSLDYESTITQSGGAHEAGSERFIRTARRRRTHQRSSTAKPPRASTKDRKGISEPSFAKQWNRGGSPE